jgi:hypothetical protein
MPATESVLHCQKSICMEKNITVRALSKIMDEEVWRQALFRIRMPATEKVCTVKNLFATVRALSKIMDKEEKY